MPVRYFGVIFLTSAESAHMLGRSEKFIRKHLRNAGLVGIKLGRNWLIPPEELNSFVTALGVFHRGHRVKDKVFQLIHVYILFLERGDISHACYLDALKDILSPSSGGKRIYQEALRLKKIFNTFLEKGDISMAYYHDSVKQLRYFLPGVL